MAWGWANFQQIFIFEWTFILRDESINGDLFSCLRGSEVPSLPAVISYYS